MISNENVLTEFKEKVVIVTGAARGIGKVTALEFGKQGASVVIVDVREKELEEVSKIIYKPGIEVLPLTADVSNRDQVEDVIKKTVTKFGKIDILVNNAGIVGPSGLIVDLSEEDWDQLLRINLKSVFLFCKYTVPIMIRNKKGAIVNVASIAGKEGTENLSGYSASKAGVIIFSRVLAKEVAKEGIRVNSIAPGTVKTDILSTVPQEMIDNLIAKVPMGRIGYPEEVADLILFLSSGKSSYITGQCFNVTGGRR